jgi:hypothetical protein
MIWVAWRLNRVQILTLAALTVAGVAFLLYTRSNMLDYIAEHHMTGCIRQRPATEECARLAETFDGQYGTLNMLLQAAAALLPVILGIFCGGPLFARELEHGTHVLALTQSVSRRRWFALKTAMALLPAVAAMAVLTAALWSLIWAPGYLGVLRLGLYEELTFDTGGIAPIGYTAFAVAIGIVLGIARRHTVTAMAGTLAAFAVARFLGEWVRSWWITLLPTDRILEPPEGAAQYLPDLHHGGEIAFGFLKSDGTTVDRATVLNGLQSCFLQATNDPAGDPATCYTKAGFTHRYTDVLSGDYFWTAQLIETLLFAGVAVGLLALGVWLLRKRSL